jgi:tRNA splicing ligase
MNANLEVEADFKCGSGMEYVLPLAALGCGIWLVALRYVRRRG